MALTIAIVLAVVISAVTSNPASSTLDRINQINSIQDSWKAGVNELSDKSFEFKKKLCGALRANPEDKLPVKEDIDISNSIPASFDARTQWPHCQSIKSIKNQGECGSCWAVAAVSAASDRLCIASNYKVHVNISAENLMCCCSYCSVTGGCDGGYPEKAWSYLENTGVVTGGDYQSKDGCQPYQIAPTESANYYTPPCSKKCTNKKYGFSYSRDLRHTKSAYSLPSKNVEAIQTEIMQHGPVEAAFVVYEDFFDYTSGVYQHTTQFVAGRHAVRVIGWGTENKTPYWLVANSWGTGWGENGLFKILRGSDECEFEENITAGLPKY